jgi:hypothetical protein
MSAPNSINAGMAVTTFDNPMGIDAFEFVEFAAPAGQAAYMHEYLRRMGFTATMRHRTRAITLFRQGGVTFLLNEEPDSFASDYAAAHGPSACGFAIGFTKPVPGSPWPRCCATVARQSPTKPTARQSMRPGLTYHRPPDAQPASRQHGEVGRVTTSASSISARSATSTSRASRPASSPRP